MTDKETAIALEAARAVFGERIFNALKSAHSITDLRIIRDAGLQCFINDRRDTAADVLREYLRKALDENQG